MSSASLPVAEHSFVPGSAKDGAVVWPEAGDQSLRPPAPSQPAVALPHPPLPVQPPRSSCCTLATSPPSSGPLETCLPQRTPPPPQPRQSSCFSFRLALPGGGRPKGECGGLGGSQHRLFIFVLLYFTLFISSHVYLSIPLSLRQYTFLSDSFQSELQTSVHSPLRRARC